MKKDACHVKKILKIPNKIRTHDQIGPGCIGYLVGFFCFLIL